MTCTKCGGLIVTNHDETKCLNCGRRPMSDAKATSEQLPKRDQDRPSGKRGWSDEAREKHRKTMREVWAKKGKGKGRPAQSARPKRPADPAKTIGTSGTVFHEEPGETKPAMRETITTIGETNGGASWDEWKFILLAQLQDAERKLREKLDAVMTAQGTIRAL